MDNNINLVQLGELFIELRGFGDPDQFALGLLNSKKNPLQWAHEKDPINQTSGSVTPVVPKPPGKGPGGLPTIFTLASLEIYQSLESHNANPTIAENRLNKFFKMCSSGDKSYTPGEDPPRTLEDAKLRPVDLITAALAFHWYAEANPTHALRTKLVEMSNRLVEIGTERLSGHR
ncbi:MAG: hypothetical protein ACK6B2_17630 [Planctomycetota bacterium]|jgi:hypothetical protein